MKIEFSKINSYVRPGTNEFRYAHNGVSASIHQETSKKWTGSVNLTINIPEFKSATDAINAARRVVSQMNKMRSDSGNK